MSLHVGSPAVLWALAVLPLFPATARGARVAGLCRALAAGALVLVLAGAALERDRPARGACVVAAIDVSASVGTAATDRAREVLGELLPALGPNDLVGAVAFAAHARVLAAPGPPPRSLSTLLPAAPPPEDEASETDLAAAVTTAGALCPATKQAAVLLFTDGNETQGDVLAEAVLADPPVLVFPDPTSALPDVALRRLLVPRFAPAGTVVPVSAVVEAHVATSVAVAFDVDGRTPLPRPLTLKPGVTVVTVRERMSDPGDHRVDARVLVPPGHPPVARRARSALTVTRPVRVLVVSERPAAPVVATALEHQGIETEVVAPADFAARSERLFGWHAVVLDDVARAALPAPALEALAGWVARGGALVVTGGGHLFGDPGFVASPLARVLPVTFVSQTPEPEEREPIGLYLLIDRSNSMAEVGPDGTQKIEYARRAALAVLEQLSPRDLVGAIAFDSEPYELAPLAPVAETETALAGKIRRLHPGGGTDFLDSLARAGRALVAAGAPVRHVILLTDGDTNRHAEDHEPVLAELRAANVSVTTIRIGSDTVNLELLHAIARTTGGEFHHVTDLSTLPQLMIRDTQREVDASAGRQDARARLVDPGPILAGVAERELPPVARWAITRAKREAQLRLVADAGKRRDPLVVTWQYELGRVAVVPLDFQAAAAGWAAWPGFAPFLARIVLWAAPRGLPGDRQVEVRRGRAGAEIRVETVADTEGPLVVALPTGDVVLRRRARRRFTAVVPALDAGPVHAELRDGSGPATAIELTVPAVAASGREARALGPATARLQALARATGGSMAPSPSTVLAARGGATRESRPLATVLVPFALVCLLADVALRRPARAVYSA